MPLQRIHQPEPKRNHKGLPIIDGEVMFRCSNPYVEEYSGLLRHVERTIAQTVCDSPELIGLGPDGIIDEANRRGAAARGTATHAVLEAALHGEDVGDFDEDIVEDAHAAMDLLASLELTVVASELFVVCDEIGAAGTLDLLLRDSEGDYIIGDLKTVGKDSAWQWSGSKWASQLAIYARGLPLGPQGLPVPWESLGLGRPLTDQGLVVQVIQREARALPIICDLNRGWQSVLKAAEFRKVRDLQHARPLV